MWSDARSARSGSSSCAAGTPKAAITASPMNFSTVPPSASSSSRIAFPYDCITSRNRSGSSRSPSAVDPVTSANRTVTTFRSWPRFGNAVDDPHEGQKRASSGSGKPQVAQAVMSGLPHAAQKRAPAAFSDPQARHAATGGVYGGAPSAARYTRAHAGSGEAVARRSGSEVGGVVGDRRYLPLRPVEDARPDLRDRHTATHGERQPPRRARDVVHAHRPDRSLPTDARQGGLLPDRMGRQRPRDGAACAEPLRRSPRSVAPVRSRVPHRLL